MRGSSVGFGEGPAPSFAPAVQRAAKRAGCRLRADPSAVGIHLLISDIVPLHRDDPDYRKVPRPPTNGHHRPLWADWGFYQQPVPYAYEVHNLEHGAVVDPPRPRASAAPRARRCCGCGRTRRRSC